MESDTNSPANSGPTSKEWKLLEKLLGQAQAEQRKTRRWGIFFKSLTFIYLFALLFMMTGSRSGDAMAVAEPHVAVVDLNGRRLLHRRRRRPDLRRPGQHRRLHRRDHGQLRGAGSRREAGRGAPRVHRRRE
jgi:hypothetical protein